MFIYCLELRQDNCAVAVLGFVTVSPDRNLARNALERLEDWVYDGWPDVEITGSQVTEL